MVGWITNGQQHVAGAAGEARVRVELGAHVTAVARRHRHRRRRRRLAHVLPNTLSPYLYRLSIKTK